MTIDEAIKEVMGEGKSAPFIALEATRLAIKALKFMRDHKCSARKDQEFREWIEQERKNLVHFEGFRASLSYTYDIFPRIRVLDSILRYLDEPETKKTPPKPTGDYFGAEF